jgi:hypothetical protein
MQSLSRVLAAAAFALVASVSASEAQQKSGKPACANCKPAARTVVKTNYKYRTVQRVNNVTRFRDVQKVNNVYMVRNLARVRVVRISYVMRDLGMKRVSAAEYARLQRGTKPCRLVKCRPSMRVAAATRSAKPMKVMKAKAVVKAKPKAKAVKRPPMRTAAAVAKPAHNEHYAR